jgi:two-component system, sensor histidine kinase and response regulator
MATKLYFVFLALSRKEKSTQTYGAEQSGLHCGGIHAWCVSSCNRVEKTMQCSTQTLLRQAHYLLWRRLDEFDNGRRLLTAGSVASRMNAPELGPLNPERVKLFRYDEVLGSVPDKEFHDLARLAAQVMGAPMALIAFADAERFWLKGKAGLELTEIECSEPICRYAFNATDIVLVENAESDSRFSKSPLVTGSPFVRFVAAVPLRIIDVSAEGSASQPIGILCVLDTRSRGLSEEQSEALRILSRQVLTQIELRRSYRAMQQKHDHLEHALRNSEAFYHSLVETIPQNIFRKDRLGRFTFANSRFCETLKRSCEEVIGKTDFDLFPPELAAKYQQDDRRVLEQRELFKTIEQHRDADGNTLFVQVIKSPLVDPSGELAGVQGIFWDETERYKIQEALAYERDLLRAMLDNIPDSIYFKDRQSRFLAVSRSLAIRLGLNDPAEAVGKTDSDFFGSEHARQALADEQNILRTGQPLIAKTEREQWLDGQERWVLSTKVPLKNRQGEIIGTFGISKDITELKTTEAELAKARDLAVESARLKSEFLANMSHEIRTPLNAVIGMTGLLMDSSLSQEQRDFAETIRNSAEALLNIINDLLDFSKIEAGKMGIEIIDFDLSEVVEGTAELLAEAAQAKDIELASWMHDEVPRHLRGDPGRLRQVLTNLLGNAVKFTQKGEVLLEVTKISEGDKKAMLRFSVRDTGIGIAEDAKPRLFRAFVQADGSTTRRYGGTGLGLAISRQLVELMGGEMGFESTVGQGSTFWLTIPLEIQPTQGGLQREWAATFESVRILVVDDNETNREIVHHQVLSWKMRNGSAQSGAAALEMLEAAARAGDPFQVAILDMQMPEMDGITLARAIKSNSLISSTQLVMLTSLGHLPEERQWREAGIAAYLVKPVKEARLYDTLATVLGRLSSPRARGPAAGTLPIAPCDQRRAVRVLVAEDNVMNQKVALLQLQKLGYSADAVGNGLEVLQAIKRVPYKIILMDCQMPELDGYETTRFIRGEEQRSPKEGYRLYIIAMTANALTGDREECIAAGMDDYISKPVRVNELEAAIIRGLQSLDAAASSDLELLDPEILQSVQALRTPGESQDPLVELIDLFLHDTPIRISKILDAFKASNRLELERTAHSLKGSASNLGAKYLAGACLDIISIVREGKMPDSSCIARIMAEFERLKPVLQKLKEQ